MVHAVSKSEVTMKLDTLFETTARVFCLSVVRDVWEASTPNNTTMATTTGKIPTKANATFWDSEETPTRTWEMFERSVELFFKTTKLQIGRDLSDSEKNLIILGSLGAKGLDQFFRSTDPTLDVEKEKHTDLLSTLRGMFKISVSRVRAFHDFANAVLEPAETVNDFIARITPLCRDAELVMKDLNYFLAMKIAHGCGKAYPDTQKLMLSKQKPDLQDFKNLLLAAETTRADQKVLNSEPTVNAVSAKAKIQQQGCRTDKRRNKDYARDDRRKMDYPRKSGKCTRCGASEWHGKDACPAKHSHCHKCNGVGHWMRCCLSKAVKAVKRIGRCAVKTDFAARVDILADGARESHIIRCDVDSGADISGVTQQQFDAHFKAAPTRPIPYNTYNFDGSRINGINKEFRCVMAYGDKVWLTWLPILPNSYRPTIGKDGIKALNMTLRGADMKVFPADATADATADTTADATAMEINAVSATSKPEGRLKYEGLLAKFPTLTSPEMGRVPDYEHKIELAANAVPKISKLRPIPAARIEGVKAAVEELESLGIWQKVDRAPWILNLVAVDKHDGSIRVTTDFKPLNKFVKPVIHPLPTITEIHSELSQAKYFSTLDVVKFYHNKSDESQELTATITPWGLYQYLVLPMGLTDSGAVAQKYISNLLSDIKRCRAYIDDIVIFAETV